MAVPRNRICLADVSQKLTSRALMNTYDVIKVGYMQHAAINVGPKKVISQYIISYVYVHLTTYKINLAKLRGWTTFPVSSLVPWENQQSFASFQAGKSIGKGHHFQAVDLYIDITKKTQITG